MPIPTTTTATSHAVAIRANSVTIGLIQTWAPSQTRTVTPVYEINPATTGEIIENVPGNVGGTTIQVTRYDLFKSRMEQVWGPSFNINMLSDQTDPLLIQEKWTEPDGNIRVDQYEGVWFSSLGRNMAVQGDRLINVSATLNYTRKRKLI